jgi:uncharacterized protein YdaU (DUF1376 family)
MGKQPYIPLYIGDWEQDTNCLSLEAEGAWLKVVFKCWKNSGLFQTTYESLAHLFKKDAQKVASILLEWKTNNICNIEPREDGAILIICRRLVRDAEISRKRAESGSKGGSKTKAKPKQTEKKEEAKDEQIPEYEYESGIDIEDKLKGALDEIYLDKQSIKWPHIDFDFEYNSFCEKVRGSPDHYRNHDNQGIRLAFQAQLRNAKHKKNGNGNFKDKRQTNIDTLATNFAKEYGTGHKPS